MSRYTTPNYDLNVPEGDEPPDAAADFRTLADRLDQVLASIDTGREFLSGTGEPSSSLGSNGDIYFERT